MVITLYGLGAIGSNLLVQLAKQYPDFEFRGVDFDKVEDRNIRTQAYFLEHASAGLHKVDAMRIVLSRYLRKPKYTAIRTKVARGYSEMVKPSDLAIDCFDNTESRRVLQAALAPSGVALLHVGFSPEYTAECIWTENYSVPNDVDPAKNDICSMGDAVSFIHFVVNATVLNISRWMETQKKRDFIVTGKSRIQWL